MEIPRLHKIRKPVSVLVLFGLVFSLAGPVQTSIVSAAPAACTTTITNHIAIDTIWSNSGSPYCLVMSEPVQIGVDATLTISPGVTVFITDPNGGLIVNGTLDAFGTQLDPVVFTSDESTPQPGDWGRISVPTSGQAQMEYCQVGYAGSNTDEAILVETDNFELNNSRVHHTAGRGFDFWARSA